MSDPAKLFTHPQPLAAPQFPQMASIPQTPLASEQLAAGSTASWRLWFAGTAALACLFAPDVCAQDITTEVHSFTGKTILVSGETDAPSTSAFVRTSNSEITKAELESAIEASTTKGLVQLLKEWMAAGDDLGKRLDEAEDGENEIQTKEDLAAVIAAIESLTTKPVTAQVIDNLKELSSLGGNLEDEDLEDVFAKQGVPSLLAWGSEQVNSPPSAADDQEKLVKFLVPLTWREDAKSALLVVTAAKSGLAPQSDVWKRLFSIYTEDHPRTDFVLRGVSRSLPDEKIGLAILSATNQLFLEDWEGANPYNSQAGVTLLEEWLLQETDDSSPAFQVALGLAFMDAPIRKKLLPLALDHKFRSVQLEAAWADAKHDGTRGLQVLKEACLNLTESVRAQQYLEEVGKSEEIPPTASEPKFLAKAKMTEWLQHPQELGEPPLTLEIYDQRELYWPPVKKKIIVTLLKFTYKLKEETKVGYGMVGGMSWSSFKEYDTPPNPDSLYLHHCTLEMQRGKRTEKVTDDKAARAAALKALRSGNAGKFTDPTLK